MAHQTARGWSCLNGLRRLRNGRNRARRGIVAVEMALLAPPFFLILMGTIELCLMLGAQQLMENATFKTSRLAKTGYVTTGKTQAETVSQVLNTELESYGSLIDTSHVTLTSASYSSFSNADSGTSGTSGYGKAQEIVVYTVSYPWKLFTPMLAEIIGTDGYVTLKSNIVVRNEPYS